MDGKLAIVHWNDPCFEREITDIKDMDFVKQVNVGYVHFLGKSKVVVVNAVTSGNPSEATLIHFRLITKIQYLEVK
jgi:hypothetical protein